MKIMRLMCALMIVAVIACACRQSDVRTYTLPVAGVKNVACEELIRDALKRTEGVMVDKLQFVPGAVIVTYDSMRLARKNIEAIIAEAGFTAGETPANPAALTNLPPACR
ncbi:MAG: hypothetical protein WCL16_12645 [bacterium]